MNQSEPKQETGMAQDRSGPLTTVPDDRDKMAVILVDGSGTIVGVSRDCEALTGYRCDELAGREIGLLLSELSEVRHEALAFHGLEAVSDVAMETRLNSKNAGAIPVVARVSRIARPDGELGYAVVVANSSEVEKANSMNCGSKPRLAKEEFQEGFLLAMHDTRGPLATIRGYLKMLETSDIDVAGSQIPGIVRGALGAADRLEDILGLLAEKGRSGSDGLKRQVLLSDLANRAANGLDHGLRSSHSSLVIENLGSAYVNPDEMTEVFQNLIENAIRYGRAGGEPARIRIWRVRSDVSQMVQIAVCDRGPGIPEEDRERIFEAFQRSEDSDQDALGLGLAICKRYVNNNGGSIWVEASEGGGGKFVFTLPRRRPFD